MHFASAAWNPIVGGLLIGLSASILLFLDGRVFGVSGILAGALLPRKNEAGWRFGALIGLIAAGVVFLVFAPHFLVTETHGSRSRYVLAGLLVGFGTQLGSGCTSGHGVCGVSRLSLRSIVATAVFILSGMAMVALIRSFGGAP